MRVTYPSVAWLCLLTVVFTGCYSTAMIDPRGDEQEKIYTKTIKKVVTTEGTSYTFGKSSLFRNESTTAAKDSIVGFVDGKRISVPLSDVSEVYVSEFQPVLTVVVILGAVGVVVGLIVGLNALASSFGSF